MEEIKISLEYHELFKVMDSRIVKRIVVGMMSAAKGEEVKGITSEIMPTFMKLMAWQEADREKFEAVKRELLQRAQRAHNAAQETSMPDETPVLVANDAVADAYIKQLEGEYKRMKEGERQGNAAAQETSRPTEEQAFEYMRTCNGRTLREDVARKMAREFLEYNDKRGWKNNSGQAIVVWENCARGWVRRQEGRKGESIYESQTGGINLKTLNNNH